MAGKSDATFKLSVEHFGNRYHAALSTKAEAAAVGDPGAAFEFDATQSVLSCDADPNSFAGAFAQRCVLRRVVMVVG